MKQIVFLYNELLSKQNQEKYRLPLEFVCFAYVNNAVLYNFKGSSYMLHHGELKKTNKNKKVYGALYILDNSEHNLRVLDAIMSCSKSLIGKNHIKDIMHREYVYTKPIHFKKVEDFIKMRYNEKEEEIQVISYFGNINNDYIKSNVLNTTKNREMCGFDIEYFINLLCEKE